MNEAPQKPVGETADALAVIRSGERARLLGVNDPYAVWFADETGRRMAAMAESTDRVFLDYNLLRYRHTTGRLRALLPGYRQAVFLGAGFDCRPLDLEVCAGGQIQVFEVDTAAKLAAKKAILAARGVTLPAWVHPVPGDLAGDDLAPLLAAAGLKRGEPVLILAEGLFFYLPPAAAEMILAPDWLSPAAGSRLIFDCWSNQRVAGLNGRVRAKLGVEFFHPFPLQPVPQALPYALLRFGWRTVEMTSLVRVAESTGTATAEDEFPSSWWITEAAC